MDKYQSVAVHVNIKNSEGKYLIFKRSPDCEYGPSLYDIPGGRVDFGENPNESAAREVVEELGINVKNLKPVFILSELQKEVRHQIWIIYECDYDDSEIKLNLEEHTEYHWVTLEEAKEYSKIGVIDKFFEFLENNS